jgi:amino acid adenylation domain-containing protein
MSTSQVEGFRLSPQQKRVWLLQQAGGAEAYRSVCVLYLEGSLDQVKVESALLEVTARNEILRTVYPSLPGMSVPVQVIGGSYSIPISTVDLSDLNATQRETQLATLFEEARRLPFDYEKRSPLAATLIKLGPRNYALLLTLSALSADSATLETLKRQLLTLLVDRDGLNGEPAQYADISEVFNELIESEETEGGRAYWRQKNLPEPLRLESLTRSVSASNGFAPELVTLAINPSLLNLITAHSQKHGVSTRVFLLACWQVLLWRLTGQDEFSIGLATQGRTYEEIEEALGLFARYLPVSTALHARLEFVEVLNAAEQASQEVEKWQDYFTWPQDEAALAFFPVSFDFAGYPALPQSNGVSASHGPEYVCLDRFEIRLSTILRGEQLTAALYYDSAVYAREEIERLAQRFAVLLESAARFPETEIGRLEILDENERRQLLVEFNATGHDFEQDKCLHQLVEAQVDRSPNELAVISDDKELTYAELDARANQLAHRLQKVGVGPEVRVAVCAERSIEMLIALLGTLKAGGAYVPLDPSYPRERLAFVLDDTGARVLLIQKDLESKLPAHDATVLYLDGVAEEQVTGKRERPLTAVTPDNLAYVIYTSGSTGNPKGVLISHRSINNRLLWTNHTFPLSSGDRLLQKTPYTFDASIWELFAPLLAGAVVVMARRGGHQDPSYLAQTVAEREITILQLVPSMLRVFLQQEGVAQSCRTLKRMFCGGEALPADLRDHFYRLLEGDLINLYGPTESAIDAAGYQCERDNPGPMVPLGRPLTNIQIFILDRHLQPAPIGVGGELHIGGIGLARGYLNRPDLTAAGFIPNPFATTPGARLYRTGDLARYLPDGRLEFLGRLDHQVKLRGFRIEPGEIEATLRAHPAVQEVVVQARATRTADKELVAYVVPSNGFEQSALVKALQQSAREKLPEYMVPAAFVVLEELPRTLSGKIDLRALPQPDRKVQESDEESGARTPIAEVVAGIWSEVLGLDHVNQFDDFFELGGHSLLVTQVMARVREAFGVDLPLRDFFEARILNQLATMIDAALKTKHNLTSLPIQRAERFEHLPLSFAQQRLWFLDQMEPGNPFYSIPAAVRLKGELDVAALEQTFNEIVRRHESLRTTFIPVDGNPVQVIAPSSIITLEVIDLSELAGEQREAEAMRRVAEDGRQPFDLMNGPLLRPLLLKLDDDDHLLLFSMHHIISDVWSRGVLIRELRTLYLAFSRKQPSLLPELPLQYADFASWQRHWLRDETLESQLSYWRQQLEGAPAVLELPTDRPRPPVQSLNGAQETLVLPETLLAAVRSLSRREGATMFMTLLAAFNALLYRLTGRTDIVVGAPIANRDRLELEGIIGFFTNTLVLRTNLTGDPSFRDLLKRVREVALGAYTHRDLPFEALVEALQPERDLSYPPLFQVMFVHQVSTTEAFELPGLTLSNVGVDNGSAKFDMTLFLVEGSGSLAAMLEYNSDLFDATTARRTLQLFENLLTTAVAEPEQPIAELELLSPAEQRRMLREWNETTREFAVPRLIHLSFEEQVERTPNSIALTFGTEELTYRELNRRANRLAHYLQANGVGPDVLVGICLERSIDLVVSMLAILKAGGVYVPLDATYPKERLSSIAGDAPTALCLTQARLGGKIAGVIPNLVYLDEEWTRLAQESDRNPVCTTTAENLAYVVFTSGSTGRPKGIAMRHESLFNLVSWLIDDQKPQPGDRTLQFASLNFDTSNLECFTTWCTGGTLVLIPEEVRHNISSLLNFLVEGEINRLSLPFVVLQQIVEIAESEGPIPFNLREVNTAGEQLQITSQVISFFEKLKNCVLHNHYGPSECHAVTTHTLAEDRQTWPALPPVGKPIYNTQIYLLDRRLHPVPVGVAGELYIGGVSLARGYFNRPDLTATAFVPNPFSDTPGTRLYRTGDLARYLPDGTIEFLGRIDQQVKVRGFRIETGEVEAALRDHPDVQEVVVAAHGVRAEEKRLVAYVVPRNGLLHDTLANDLRQRAREKLPEYMVPSAIVLLDRMPLTSDGKVNRRALPEPQLSRRDSSEEFVAARTPVEEVMAGVWGEVLGLERVGVHDNFFHLGGHSLLATRVVARLREAFGTPFPLRKIFEEPTIAGLAQALDETIKTARGVQTLPIERVSHDAPLPVSFIQARTLFMAQLEGRPSFYSFEIHLHGNLDVDALARSLSEVVRRHEVLRTTFTMAEGQPVQVINPAMPVDLPLIDLGELSEVARETRAREVASQQGSESFDLSTGPLLRLRLLRLSESEHRLLLSIPHIACDRWSIGLFSTEVSSLYRAFSQSQPSPLAELPLQYADFAVWQRRWLEGEVMDNALNYWKEQLKDVTPVLKLPTDRPRPPVKTYEGNHFVFALPKELSEGVDLLSQRERCTRFMTLLAVFKTLLYRYTEQQDIVVGTAVAGRTQTGIEKLIGNFGTPLALRTQLSGDLTFRELIRRVREVALNAYAYQELPFEKLLEALDIERDPAYSPLIQVGFVVHNDTEAAAATDITDLSMQIVSVDTGRSNFDLTMNLHHTSQGLVGSLEYSTVLFNESTIKRMVEHFRNLLESILAEPDKRLAELSMSLAAAEAGATK